MRTLSSSAVLLLVGGLLSAQTAKPATSIQPLQQFQGELQHYKLHYASGKLTKLDDPVVVPGSVQAASTPTYLNDCNVTSFVTLGADELIDWGVKAGGVSNIVDSFSFGYATDAPGAAVGGPGATLEISFYEGNTGFGVLGTEVARFSFTGLPGSTTGGVSGFFLDVDLTGGPGFCLPDGPIGYGYCSADLVNSTGPILVDVTVCSTNGTIDAFDVYTCPATTGPYIGTFNLMTPNISSFYMEINEDDATEVATTTPNNGTGINPVLLDDGGTPAIIGQTWPATIDISTSGYNSSVGLWTVGSLGAPIFLAGGEVILNILDPNGFVITNAVIAQAVNDHSVFVVKDLTLIGIDLTCQGLLFGGIPGYQLTNAIEIHLGY